MASTINASSTGSGGLISTGDASGVLQLQSNGSNSLTIDTANSVLINGASAATADSKLNTQVTTANALTTLAEFRNLDYTAGTKSFVRVRNQVSAGGSGSGYFGFGSDNRLYMIANNSARGGDIVIDGGNGAVLTPSQPAFQVYGTSLTGTTYLGGTTGLNVGSFFNTSTGIFTAPIAGNYLFSFSLSIADANSQFINIYKNGSLYAGNMLQYTATFTTGSQTLIIPLAASDTVNAGVRDNTYAIYNARFCGYLLG